MECLKCGHKWDNIVDKPIQCPKCNQRKFNEPRLYSKRSRLDIKDNRYTEQLKEEDKSKPINIGRRIISLD